MEGMMKFSVFNKGSDKIVNLNRRKAIREKCISCCAFSCKKVSKCNFTNCELFVFRTGQGKQDPKERVKAIRKYCLWCCCGSRNEVKNCKIINCSLFPFRKSELDKTYAIKEGLNV
jgi:hypothetical protein